MLGRIACQSFRRRYSSGSEAFLWAGLASACALAACSDYKPASDIASTGGSLQGIAANWGCLKTAPNQARTPGTPGQLIVYSLRLVDLATDQPYADVPVQACGLTDIACDSPVATTTTDADGWLNVRLTENFSGYLEIDSRPRAVPYLFHLPEAGLKTMADYPLAMITLESFGALLVALDLPTDPNLAAIGVRAFDCQGMPAAGVKLTSSVGGLPWYFEQGLPNTERVETNVSGLGGFIGTPAGLSQLDAKLPDGRVIASRSIIVRGQWMSAGYLRPTGADPSP